MEGGLGLVKLTLGLMKATLGQVKTTLGLVKTTVGQVKTTSGQVKTILGLEKKINIRWDREKWLRWDEKEGDCFANICDAEVCSAASLFSCLARPRSENPFV